MTGLVSRFVIVLLCTADIAVAEDAVCQSTACKETAKRILDSMDKSTEACKDFYKFACGKFLHDHTIPDYQGEPHFIAVTEDKINKQLVSLFDETPKHDEALYSKLQTMYKHCMDQSKIDQQGLNPVLEQLKAVGGWPVLGNWKEEGWHFIQTEIGLERAGFQTGGLIQVHVVVDRRNPKQYMLQVGPADLWLFEETLILTTEDEMFEIYYKFMVDIAVLFGADPKVAEEQQRETINYEIELSHIMAPDLNDEVITLKQLSSLVPWIKWKEFLSEIIPKETALTDDEPIIVTDIEFLQKLERLVKGRSRVVANTMIWQAIRTLVDLESLPSGISNRRSQLEVEVDGEADTTKRNEICSYVTYTRFPLATSFFYVKKYFNEDSKKAAAEVIDHIQQEMIDDIDTLDWMDPETKKEAIAKASKMQKMVGYPEELNDVKSIEKFYEELTLNQDNYALLLMSWAKWNRTYYFKILRETVSKADRWTTATYDISGHYNNEDNTLRFSAGLLQLPFFSHDVPKYVNYATMGRLIAERIIQAFDDEGRHYDSHGEMKRWWGTKTFEQYHEKRNCFILQYGNFKDSITDENLDSTASASYNMRDLGAMKIAYRAFKKYAVEDPKLPDLGEFSTNKLFWLTNANMFCTKLTPELAQSIRRRKRIPSELRVNAVFSMMPEFSTDFGCEPSSPLKPSKQCALW